MSDTDHLTLSRDELEMPTTAEGIISVIRRILNKPYVQSISLSQGNPIQVTWYRDLSDSLDTREPDESTDSVLGRVNLEEISGHESLKELLLDGLMKVSLRGEFPSHLLVGNIETFKDSLGLPKMLSLPKLDTEDQYNFAGVPLIEVASLQEDSIVLLSAGIRNATLAETKSGLKLSI